MNALFGLLYLLHLPLWILMLLFPKTNVTRRLVTSPWPFIVLGGIDALLLIVAITGLPPASWGLSLASLRALLASDAGLLAVWANLLTLGLFAGVWIHRDAGYWSIGPAPYLLLTHFAAPVGLGAYHLQRRRRERRDVFRTLN
mgnify:CR=1 FL=1